MCRSALRTVRCIFPRAMRRLLDPPCAHCSKVYAYLSFPRLPPFSSSFFSSLIDFLNAVYTTFLLAYIQNASEKREPLHFDHHPAAKYVAAWTPPHRHRVRGADTSTGNTKKKGLFPPNFDSFLENCITIYILPETVL